MLYTLNVLAHEKVLNFTIREMKSKLQWGINLYQSEWLSSKSLQTNARESAEKRGTFYTVSGNVNWYNHYGEQYGGSFKN